MESTGDLNTFLGAKVPRVALEGGCERTSEQLRLALMVHRSGAPLSPCQIIESKHAHGIPEADLLILVAKGDELSRYRSPAVSRPEWSALARTRDMRRAGVTLTILVVLPAAAAGDVPEYFYAGADDCLTWPSSTEHLAARVFALVRRGRYTYDDRSDYRLEVDPNAGNVTIDGAAFALKGKRFDIFVYLAQNRDRWVKSEELLKNVFETHHRSDTSLVRVHVHRLKRSLGALGWLVQSEERRGYRISFQKRAA